MSDSTQPAIAPNAIFGGQPHMKQMGPASPPFIIDSKGIKANLLADVAAKVAAQKAPAWINDAVAAMCSGLTAGPDWIEAHIEGVTANVMGKFTLQYRITKAADIAPPAPAVAETIVSPTPTV